MKVLQETTRSDTDFLLSSIEAARRDASLRLDPRRRALMGQFLTPASVATFMAEMFECKEPIVRILDPGAGPGALSAAFVLAMSRRPHPPSAISLTAYEMDPLLVGYLRKTLDLCRTVSEDVGIRFEGRIVEEDFLEAGAKTFSGYLERLGGEIDNDISLFQGTQKLKKALLRESLRDYRRRDASKRVNQTPSTIALQDGGLGGAGYP